MGDSGIYYAGDAVIRFAHPLWLHGLWLLPLLFAAAWGEYHWRLKALRRWALEPLWEASLGQRAPDRIFTRRIIGAVALGFIMLALSGPQVGTRLVEVRREGTDLVIAMDVSQSMLAEDITPTRLLKARHEISRLLNRLRGDRVALVPFAGVAFVQVPLTLDYAAVIAVLDALEPGIIPQPGTALGEAIQQAQRAFRIESKAQKVMILISDGEDHESNAVEQAKAAAKEGIIIFTVGMASPSGGPIPQRDERGQVLGYKKDKQGGTVISKLNEELLTDIAEATGGKFYRASNSGSEFQEIYKQMTGMDTEQFEAKQFTDYEDRFQWPLAMAFLLIILEECIPPGRMRRNKV
ncbi:MAG: VWA domain-containing protein [Calditrichota bacterium]